MSNIYEFIKTFRVVNYCHHFVFVINCHFLCRAKDIFPLIDIGYSYYDKPPRMRHINSLPTNVPHSRVIHRPVIVCIIREFDMYLLVHTRDKPHIPSCYVGCTDSSSRSSIYTILKVCHRSIYKPHIPSCYVGCTDSSSRSSIYTILKVCHHSIYKPHIPSCYVGCTDSLSRSSIYTILKVCHRSIYKPHIPSCYVGFTDSSSRISIYIQFSRYVTVLYINHTYHHVT